MSSQAAAEEREEVERGHRLLTHAGRGGGAGFLLGGHDKRQTTEDNVFLRRRSMKGAAVKSTCQTHNVSRANNNQQITITN